MILLNSYLYTPGSVTATKLTFFAQPDGGVTGVDLTLQPIVYAVDANNNVDATFTGNVTLTKINGTGTLSGTLTKTAIAGVATFTNVRLTGAGHYVLEATASGLTAKRSGMMTINPVAPTAPTGLTFGAATTDKGDCGSAASIDNLTANSMTFICRCRRTSDGSNQFLATKYNGGVGWYVQVAITNGEGTVVCLTSYSGTDPNSTVTGAGNLMAKDVWYDLAATWRISDRRWRVFLKPVGTALAEVTTTQVTNNTTRDSDAAANLYLGNLQNVGGANPFKGDILWAAVFAKELSNAQMLTCQVGFSRENSAMITGVGSCSLLHRMNATGTLTDLSSNGNDCVITGATTMTGPLTYSPSVWGNSTDATNSTDYWFTNSHATVSYLTSATSALISAQRTLEAGAPDPPGYDPQGAVVVFIDGIYFTEATFPRPLTAINLGKGFATVTLPAGSKTVTFANGSRSRPVGTAEGTFLTSVAFNASATEVIPLTPSQNIVFLVDSIFCDFLANPIGQFGVISTFRQYIRSSQSVMIEGYGGSKFKDYATDATARAATVAKIALYNPTTLVFHMGANDYGGQGGVGVWSAAAFGSALDSLLSELHTELPLMSIFVLTMVTRPAGEGANANPISNTAAQYRTAAANAGAGKAYVTVVDGPTGVWDGTASADNSHPNNTGSAAILAKVKTFLGV